MQLGKRVPNRNMIRAARDTQKELDPSLSQLSLSGLSVSCSSGRGYTELEGRADVRSVGPGDTHWKRQVRNLPLVPTQHTLA